MSKLRAGKIPKEFQKLGKIKEEMRIKELEKNPRYQQKLDDDLLREYDPDYIRNKEAGQRLQKDMQTNSRLRDAKFRQLEAKQKDINLEFQYKQEQERLRAEAEERARRKASDPFSNIMSGLSTVASLIPGVGSAISTGLDVVRDGTNLIRETAGGNLKKKQKKRNVKNVKGSGLFDDIKNKFIIQKKYNNVSTRTLKDYGNNKIISLKIVRTPIQKMLKTILNVISFNAFNTFDQLYHLALIATVENNKDVIIEKNAVVNINLKYQITEKSEVMEVPYNENLTVNELLTNTLNKIGDDKFFLYNGLSQNCQMFVRDILKSNNLYSESINDFLFQDLTELKAQLPDYVGKTMNVVTDLGAIASQLMGAGLKIHSVKIKKTVPFDDALKHFHNIVKNKNKKYYKDMKNHYNFRFIPKTKFIPKSFKTKKINNEISLILGVLKD
jgi:hypothetical protein